MLKITKDRKEIAKAYKFLHDVPNTNLPKIKAFINRATRGYLYLAYDDDMIICCLFIEDMNQYYSLTNLYVSKKYRFKYNILKELLETRSKFTNKMLVLKSVDVSEYKHFVKHLKDDLYIVRK